MTALRQEDPRFGGIARLYGDAGLDRLRRAHICVVGIGGVGSWTVEALARSGIGHLTLIDLDDICVTNTNRQVHALEGNVGRLKVEAMTERVAHIQPACTVAPVPDFFTATTAKKLLATDFDVVVDAIDRSQQKTLLIAMARERGMGVVTVGGAGGRRDPAAIVRGDLAESVQDPLLRHVRRALRHEHGYPRDGRPWGVPAVFSRERALFPSADGATDEREKGTSLRIDCATGYGTAAFVTGTFGFVAAACAVEQVLADAG